MQLKLNRSRTPGALTGLAVVLLALSATAPLAHAHDKGKGQGKATSKELFQSVASFDVMAGNGSSVAEIVDATRDGKQLIYTDSGNGEIGFVDIQRADRPRAQGVVAVGGEPTSLAILDSLVLVAVNTSESYIAPSGKLVVVDRRTRQIVAEHALPEAGERFERTVDSHVSRIRAKLGADAAQQLKTVWGIGYRYDPAEGGER